LPQRAALHTDVVSGTKRPAEQAVTVELVEPLAILDVCCPPRDLLCVMGSDQLDVKAVGLQHLTQRHPGDAGGFPHDRLEVTLREPLGDGVQICRTRAATPYRLVIALCWHGHPMV
jgi:hypothetical protein